MEHKLTVAGLHTVYLSGFSQIDNLDQETILRDLSVTTQTDQTVEPGTDSAATVTLVRLPHHDLRDYDHLILARDSRTSQTLALLGMYEGGTDREDYLYLHAAYVAPTARGRRIIERMAALALLRVAGSGPVPQVIVARTSNPLWYRSLLRLSRRFTGAVVYPDYMDALINLDSVRLAQRLARRIAPSLRYDAATSTIRGGCSAAGAWRPRPSNWDAGAVGPFGQDLQTTDQRLIFIDLRTQTEAAILQDARRAYTRSRGRKRPIAP